MISRWIVAETIFAFHMRSFDDLVCAPQRVSKREEVRGRRERARHSGSRWEPSLAFFSGTMMFF
jgi:hypothetical protein